MRVDTEYSPARDEHTVRVHLEPLELVQLADGKAIVAHGYDDHGRSLRVIVAPQGMKVAQENNPALG